MLNIYFVFNFRFTDSEDDFVFLCVGWELFVGKRLDPVKALLIFRIVCERKHENIYQNGFRM